MQSPSRGTSAYPLTRFSDLRRFFARGRVALRVTLSCASFLLLGVGFTTISMSMPSAFRAVCALRSRRVVTHAVVV
jgi:hypothetical protein